jgi:hypothetical protein
LAYAANDPINKYDPDGEFAIQAFIGGTIGAGIEVVKIKASGGDVFTKAGLSQVGKGALVGAAAATLGPAAGLAAKGLGATKATATGVGVVADVVGQPAVAVAGEAILSGDTQSTTAEKAVAGLGGEAGAVAGTLVDQGTPSGGGKVGALIKAGATVGSAVLAGQAVDAVIPKEEPR